VELVYRTKDGEADYGFSLEEQPDGSWRAYIVSQPSYRSRGRSLDMTHRLADRNGRYFVCWTRSVHSIEEMKEIAVLWADRTQRYIKDGTPIHHPGLWVP
jgi:hypothetical protein